MRYRKILPLLAALALLLMGCAQESQSEPATEPTPAPTIATEPTPTSPADGNPDDVTCKGSYSTGEIDADTVVAAIGDAQLTNGQLQVYYWMEIAAFRQEQQEVSPDFSQSLDTQLYDSDDTAVTWQQYFLQRALNTWHSHQAMVLQGDNHFYLLDEQYDADEALHEARMTGMPAVSVLQGNHTGFEPNEMHQEYLDNIPALLEELSAANGFADLAAQVRDLAGDSAAQEDLIHYAQLYNRSYMYFTTLHDALSPGADMVEAYFAENEAAYAEAGITKESGRYVDMRHILLIPEGAEVAQDGTITCTEGAWEECFDTAQRLVNKWLWDDEEHTFAELANKQSADAGSSINGGLYSNLHQGQLAPELDAWCFDPARQSGDYDIIRTACGIHIVYFSGSREIWYAAAEADLNAETSAGLVAAAMEEYPAEINYSAIALGQAPQSGAAISADDLLYPDIAHERYPSVPLYLQQDFPEAPYGSFKVATHGCGITTMAMLATYMTDTKLTPAELGIRFGNYCFASGTNIVLYDYTPAEMGFYFQNRCFTWGEVEEALKNGQIVVCLQYKGMWTQSGHFLILQEIREDGLVVVRDSNIYNYSKLDGHEIDGFKPSEITPEGAFYWIFDKKVTRIPTCVRCGDGEGVPESLFAEDYHCAKCVDAMERRGNFIAACEAAK